MTGMFLVMMMLLFPAPEQDATPAGDPVDVQTRLSQSAVWPGDEIQYSIRLVMGRGVQAQEGLLSGSGMSWAPFRLVDFKQREDLRPDGGKVLTLSYRLVAIDLPDEGWASIPAIRFAYVQRPDGPTARTDFPIEERVVEGPRVVFRSMLEGAVEDATIRDGKDLEDAPLPGRALLLLGIGGLVVGAYPLGRSGYPLVKQLLSRPQLLDARSQKRHLREEVGALRRMSLADPEDFERFCRGLQEVLKEHLVNRFDLTFPGLTSLDADELRRAGLPESMVDQVEKLVDTCEELRYQRRLPEGAEERARNALRSLDEVLAP